MTRGRGMLCSLLIISVAFLVLTFPAPDIHAREKGPSPKRRVRGVVRSFDAGPGLLYIATNAGKSLTLCVDNRDSLIFQGLFPVEAGDLVRGTAVEIDYKPSEGNDLPVVSWVEILPSTSEKGDNAFQADEIERR